MRGIATEEELCSVIEQYGYGPGCLLQDNSAVTPDLLAALEKVARTGSDGEVARACKLKLDNSQLTDAMQQVMAGLKPRARNKDLQLIEQHLKRQSLLAELDQLLAAEEVPLTTSRKQVITGTDDTNSLDEADSCYLGDSPQAAGTAEKDKRSIVITLYMRLLDDFHTQRECFLKSVTSMLREHRQHQPISDVEMDGVLATVDCKLLDILYQIKQNCLVALTAIKKEVT